MKYVYKPVTLLHKAVYDFASRLERIPIML